jgi:hypothetical protein
MTYGNACQAGCAGVDIVHEGPCECPPVACPAMREDCTWGSDERGCPTCECGPTECFDDAACAPGERCNLDHCHGTCDEPGADCAVPAEDPAGLIACSGYCEPDPEPTYCYSDIDCADGERCNLDVCHGVDCGGGGEGGVPADCIAACYGICEPGGDPRCTSDDECAPEEYCQIDMCWSPAQDPAEPSEGGAIPAPPPDSCTGSCVPRTTTCFGDDECAEGEYCDFSERCGPMPYGEPDDGSGDAAIACYGLCRPAAVPL